MKFCVVGGLLGVVVRFEFHQNRSSGFGAVGIEICHFSLIWPLAYTRDCTTVQTVTSRDMLLLIGSLVTNVMAGMCVEENLLHMERKRKDRDRKTEVRVG